MIVPGSGRLHGILHAIWKPLAILTAIDVAVTVAYEGMGWTWLVPRDVPLPLMGTGLVVFLGLRNNAAYARWWEARALWGAVVNQSRNFARTVLTLMSGPDDQARRESLIMHQIAWATALRLSLRKEDVVAGVGQLLPDDTMRALDEASNMPFAVQRTMAEIIGRDMREGRLDSTQVLTLNTTLNALTDAQGGLERIRNTPMPQHYTLLPRLFVMSYGVLLPFGVVADLGLATPVGCLVVGLLFLTLDRAGANLENPFDRSQHDLPMTAINRTIEIDLKEAIGHDHQPTPLRAVMGILR